MSDWKGDRPQDREAENAPTSAGNETVEVSLPVRVSQARHGDFLISLIEREDSERRTKRLSERFESVPGRDRSE